MSELSFFQVFKKLLIEYILPHKYKISIAIFCMIVVALTSGFQVWLVKPALDKIFVNKDSKMLNYLPILIVLVSIIRGLTTYFQNYIMKYIGQRVASDMQVKLYNHLLYSDIEFLHNNSTGKIISRFVNDINVIKGFILNSISAIFKESLTVIFLVILMFYQSFTLALIGFTIFPIAILPIIKTGKKIRKVSSKTQDELGNFINHLDDSFQLIKVIKSYCKEDLETKRASTIIENIFLLYIKAIKIESLVSPLMETLSGIAIGAVIWYGGHQVIEGETSPGAFFSFIVALIAAYKPLKSLASLNSSIQEGIISTKRIFSVLDIEPKIKDKTICKDLVINISNGYKIIFDNVTFTYPNGKKALDNFSININSGQTVALVGDSGSGKSTFVNLLLRFYDVDNGKITIDHHNIKNLSVESLRQNISLVSQEILLFDDTILNNISYADELATEEDIIAAAKISLVDDFVKYLPNGYDTMVGQYGIKLSGGQKQRISIARAFLKKSKILLLDEATSSLDNNTEAVIKNVIKKWRGLKTIVIVAHRLSSIIDADCIYVFKNGKILEYGSHEKLLQLDHEYKKLYNKES